MKKWNDFLQAVSFFILIILFLSMVIYGYEGDQAEALLAQEVQKLATNLALDSLQSSKGGRGGLVGGGFMLVFQEEKISKIADILSRSQLKLLKQLVDEQKKKKKEPRH